MECFFLVDIIKRGTLLFAGQQWCISNGWELVELHPQQPQEEDPEEDDFHDSWGFKRICQALHAYTWSNLTMKGMQLLDFR